MSLKLGEYYIVVYQHPELDNRHGLVGVDTFQETGDAEEAIEELIKHGVLEDDVELWKATRVHFRAEHKETEVEILD